MKIKAIFFDVGKPLRVGMIEGSLGAVEEYLGGPLEAMDFAIDAALLHNEQGRRLKLPYNRKIFGEEVYGPALILGVDGEELCGLTDEQAENLMQMQ